MNIVQYYFSNAGSTENTPAKFSNTLNTPLDLEGEWEVGLREIQFPNSWWTLFKPLIIHCTAALEAPPAAELSEQIGWSVHAGSATKRVSWTFELPRRHYDNAHQLTNDFQVTSLKALREQVSQELIKEIVERYPGAIRNILLNYKPNTKKFSLYTGIKYFVCEFFSGIEVWKTLGFEQSSPHSFGYRKFPVDAVRAYESKFGNPGAFLIYWDALSYSAVGDSSSPILAVILPFANALNQHTTLERFEQPVYHRLTKDYINKVDFEIKDSTGELVNFHNLGQTILVVEYRHKTVNARHNPAAITSLPI